MVHTLPRKPGSLFRVLQQDHDRVDSGSALQGNVIVTSRQSPYSLYDEKLASFGKSSYSHKDATGFIRLFGLPVRVNAKVRKKLDQG